MRLATLLLLSVALAAACGNEASTTQVPDLGDSEITSGPVDLSVDRAEPDLPGRIDSGGDDAFDFYVESRGGGCNPGDGCFGDPCSSNEDCLEGWCVTHLGEGVCTRHCQDECPPGWECRQVGSGGPDLVSVCISQFTHLCRPCSSSADCKSLVTVEDVCVDYGPQGSFCGGSCDPAARPGEGKVCPWGFTCKEAVTVDGVTLHQCVADAGVCPCTATSVELGLWTPCAAANEWGTCTGKRVCGEEGLSDCSATIPAAESCNGLDDDCDAATDEPLQQGGNYINLCDDGNECTADSCLGAAGCLQEPLDVGECKDDDVCTVGDHCLAGECVGTPAICDDKNPCTDDACDGLGGCKFTANQAKCDDGDPCTVADQCEATVCDGVAVACDCQVDADCKALEDGDLCNGVLHCDTAGLPFQCAVVPDSPVVCPEPEGKDAVCLAVTCDPATGKCGFAPDHEGFACDDGDACTVGDKCQAGKCQAGVAAVCADDNPCTDDSCLPETGCQHVPNSKPCTDFDTCTQGDVCSGGQCVPGAQLSCDDANVCTDDSCDQAVGCLHLANMETCDDGNECTLLDYCAGGKCASSGDKKCDDSNPCTKDYCQALKGCVFEPAPGPCSDGNPCTLNDSCQAGKCLAGPAPDCDDANPCTTDSCGPDGTCKHEPNQAACDDGNACTSDDHCDAEKCVYGGLVDCDDANLCTDDSCDPKLGCIHKVNQNPCDDGDACTLLDKCKGGMCVAGLTLSCDDGNVCSNDSCDPAAGCLHKANAAQCNDGNACTVGDLCADLKCAPGATLSCDDSNVCTTDSCEPQTGCAHVPNANPCEDGSLCTAFDLCEAGTCKPGTPVECNDGNVCTDDGCDAKAGCTFVANTAACDDGNSCTTGDTCAGGKCTAGQAVSCDDANDCTKDTCVPATGCAHAPLPDDTACGVGPTWSCKAGICTQCVPNCTGKNCGPDGCGGSCGPCTGGVCDAGECLLSKIYIMALNNAHQGDLGGLTGANAMCNSEAKASGFNQTYKAFLSAPGQNVKDLITGKNAANVPVYNRKGEKLFDSWSQLFSSGGGTNSIWIYTFDGKMVDEGTGANPDWVDADCWTGTDPAGNTGGTHCNGWTTTGAQGTATELDAFLLLHQETGHNCTDLLAVMCVSVGP